MVGMQMLNRSRLSFIASVSVLLGVMAAGISFTNETTAIEKQSAYSADRQQFEQLVKRLFVAGDAELTVKNTTISRDGDFARLHSVPEGTKVIRDVYGNDRLIFRADGLTFQITVVFEDQSKHFLESLSRHLPFEPRPEPTFVALHDTLWLKGAKSASRIVDIQYQKGNVLIREQRYFERNGMPALLECSISDGSGNTQSVSTWLSFLKRTRPLVDSVSAATLDSLAAPKE